jgi:hypothetical protein
MECHCIDLPAVPLLLHQAGPSFDIPEAPRGVKAGGRLQSKILETEISSCIDEGMHHHPRSATWCKSWRSTVPVEDIITEISSCTG